MHHSGLGILSFWEYFVQRFDALRPERRLRPQHDSRVSGSVRICIRAGRVVSLRGRQQWTPHGHQRLRAVVVPEAALEIRQFGHVCGRPFLSQQDRVYRTTGITITRNAGSPEQQRILRDITRWHVGEFSYFLLRMKSIPERDANLLDHTCCVYIHEHAEANPTSASGRRSWSRGAELRADCIRNRTTRSAMFI